MNVFKIVFLSVILCLSCHDRVSAMQEDESPVAAGIIKRFGLVGENAEKLRESVRKNQKGLEFFNSQPPRLDDAYELLESSYELAKEALPTDDNEAKKSLAICLNILGRVEGARGNFDESAKHLKLALQFKRNAYADFEMGHPELLKGLLGVSDAFVRSGKFQQAAEFSGEAVAMSRALVESKEFDIHPSEVARYLNSQGSALALDGFHSKAIEKLEESLPIVKKHFPPAHEAINATSIQLGSALWNGGRYSDAEELLLETLEIIKQTYPVDSEGNTDKPIAYRNCNNNLALLYLAMRDAPRARAYAEAALKYSLQMYPKERFPNGHPTLASVYANLAIIEGSLGAVRAQSDYIEIAKKMLDAFEIEEDNPRYVNVLEKEASFNELNGNFADAIRIRKKTVQFQRQLVRGDSGVAKLISYLNNLGMSYWNDDDPESARECFEESRELFEKHLGHLAGNPLDLLTLMNLGAVNALLNDFENADPILEKAKAVANEQFPPEDFGDGHPTVATIIGVQALARERREQWDEAFALRLQQQKMLNQAGSQYLPFLSDSEVIHIYDEDVQVPNELIELAAKIQPEDCSKVYDLVLGRKSPVYHCSRIRNSLFRKDDLDPTDLKLLEKYEEVCQALGRAVLFADNSVATNKVEIAESQSRKIDLERQVAPLLKNTLFELVNAGSISSELSDQLPDNVIYLDFVKHSRFNSKIGIYRQNEDSVYSVFVATRGKPIAIRCVGKAIEIENTLIELYDAIKSPNSTEEKCIQVIEKFSSLVMPTIESVIDKNRITHIAISPDGLLAFVPWSALKTNDGRFLVESFSLSTVPHAIDLLDSKYQSLNTKSILGNRVLYVGDVDYGKVEKPEFAELRGTGLNAELFGHAESDYEYLDQLIATESEVLSRFAQVDIAHFATHGKILGIESRPSRSERGMSLNIDRESPKVYLANPFTRVALALSNANFKGRKGAMLSGEAIAHQDLEHVRFVNLAACNTAIGNRIDGEGVFGLQRAFHVAGVESTLASQWSQNNTTTTQLMEKYYGNLREGNGPSDAIRLAQISFLRGEGRGDSQHPYYWAGWMVGGDPGKIGAIPPILENSIAETSKNAASVTKIAWVWPVALFSIAFLFLLGLCLAKWPRRRSTTKN